MNWSAQSISPGWRRGSQHRRLAGGDGERCVPGLCFHRSPGALLAVAGLTGGAGASVLAYLTAATAARESSVPILVADMGGPTGGLACLAGVTAPLTVCDIAERIITGEPLPSPLWATGEHGLRVLAGVPQFTIDADRDAIKRILNDARQAHGLTVADVGGLARRADQAALAAATHVAWTLVASDDGVRSASRVLQRIAPLDRPEVIVARSDPAGHKPPMGMLAELAEARRATLVLMPTFGRVPAAASGELAERSQVALQAIGGALRR